MEKQPVSGGGWNSSLGLQVFVRVEKQSVSGGGWNSSLGLQVFARVGC